MKNRRARYDYGECEVCDAPVAARRANQDFWIRGKLIVVENVPMGVCPRCGEKVVKAAVGRRLTELVRDPEQVARAPRITVPAIAYH